MVPVPLGYAKGLSLALNTESHVRVRTLYDWLTPVGEKPLDYMSEAMNGMRYSPEGFCHLMNKYQFDGALIDKKVAYIYKEERNIQDWDLLINSESLELQVHRDNEDYCLILRRASIPADSKEGE